MQRIVEMGILRAALTASKAGPPHIQCPSAWKKYTFAIAEISSVTAFKPSVNSSFAYVDLLPAADETDDHCPILVPVHA